MGGHGHIWLLTDGTPAHAPPGVLTRDDAGRVACHLCGQWFAHLGLHLRRHGWTAAGYREAVGLPLRQPLCASDLSATIADRQHRRYRDDPRVREVLAPGQALARTGDLALLSARAGDARRRSGRVPAALVEANRAQLAAGRATTAARRRRRLDAVIATEGATDLHDLLRRRYEAGASLDSLRRLTGLGQAALRAALDDAGIVPRPAGHNTPAAKYARADLVDARVAALFGTDDIRDWLVRERADGRTLRDLARATGRSVQWVRSRLADAAPVTSRQARAVPTARPP